MESTHSNTRRLPGSYCFNKFSHIGTKAILFTRLTHTEAIRSSDNNLLKKCITARVKRYIKKERAGAITFLRL